MMITTTTTTTIIIQIICRGGGVDDAVGDGVSDAVGDGVCDGVGNSVDDGIFEVATPASVETKNNQAKQSVFRVPYIIQHCNYIMKTVTLLSVFMQNDESNCSLLTSLKGNKFCQCFNQMLRRQQIISSSVALKTTRASG